MLGEALAWYVESLTAFWSGMAHGGLLRLILVAAILWWLFGRRRRCWGCCPRCGCWCGRCRCREVDETGETGGDTAETAAETTADQPNGE